MNMITEGYMPFGEFKTYYRIVGDIQESYRKGMAPLVLMHGGPGSTHNYFEVLDSLAEEGRALVMYDQLGCGNSYVENRTDLWVAQTWVDELECLRKHLGLKEVHLLGQSWGGMLAITYMCDNKPTGVKSVILSSSLSSSQLWGHEQHRNIKFMSPEDQKVITEAEKTGVYDGKEYLEAVDHFMERHCCASVFGPETPECVTRPKKSGSESYVVAWGPNEFTPLGTLKEWDYTEKLRSVQEPVLVISGTNDLSTPMIAKTMYDAAPNSRWELFDGCRHMCFVEATDKYLKLVGDWMKEND